MATRRPPSSRSRTTSQATMPPPPPRSRSVMAKSSSSSHSVDNSEATMPTRPHKPLQSKNASEEAETNIQVVLRCRRRSEREIQDSSPMIVSSNGAKSTQVSIETTAPTSTLGVVTLPPIRTYPFDLVFGPEADQALIYHEVVAPMLEQVITGYNCTLFAYGQTGTGKTYTMQGDLAPSPMGNPSVNAGMIPRVLFRLFHTLDASKCDYSVKISYIELYNEELRDLLAVELSAPSGNTQPMGMNNNSKDVNKNADTGLKIFDDASKKGVFIQGIEEISVTSSKDALALLTKGSDRRQIAATKFNDHSSRSHSIFSITVHIKESGPAMEDLVKIGKLNLVDLAGSENIGRSGAENKRAREAGMINQSLLTLGRVINALVDKAQHVPYRESKLTRLLQDSLGGRTKTCIVATISPARSNMEETLSTLDYAMRAKSIRNKPELNQRTTRNSLLKEYVAEIERLKADLLAAREKNGIFFSEETWKQMSTESEMKDTQLEEQKKSVAIKEAQLRSVREEFEQSLGLLMFRETELAETRERLGEAEEVIEVKEGELKVVKGALQEEVVVRKAHQQTEGALDTVATGLKSVAHASIQDVGGLFDKLDRKSNVLNSNTKAVSTQGKTLSSSSQALASTLNQFLKTSAHWTSKLQSESREFYTKELSTLASHSAHIESQLQRVQEALSVVHAKDATEAKALGIVQQTLQETHDSFRVGFDKWQASLRVTCSEMFAEVEEASTSAFEDVEKALRAMDALVQGVLRDVVRFIERETQAVSAVRDMAEDAASAEIKRLKQQNEALVRMLEAEKAKTDKAKDELIQRVSGLLGDFARDRDEGLREAVGVAQRGNVKAAEGMQAFQESHGSRMDEMQTKWGKMGTTFQKTGGAAKRSHDGALKTLGHAQTTVGEGLASTQSTISGSVETYSVEVQKQMSTLYDTSSSAFDQHSRAKRARMEATNTMSSEVQADYRSLHQGFASTSSSIESYTGTVVHESAKFVDATDNYKSAAEAHLSSMRKATRSLAEEGAREDVPTGTTPRKRAWNYQDEWELTGSREHLLKTWKEKGDVPSTDRETFVAEHVPLQEEDDDLDDGDTPTEMVVDEEVTSKPVEQEPSTPPEYPPSLESSSSSTSIPMPMIRPPAAKKTSSRSVVSTAPLADARNVYTTRGLTRRQR